MVSCFVAGCHDETPSELHCTPSLLLDCAMVFYNVGIGFCTTLLDSAD